MQSPTVPILIRRLQARGDVLLTTPVIRHLMEKYPDRPLYYETYFPDVVNNHRGLSDVGDPRGSKFPKPHDVLSLEVAYEKMPGVALMDAFASRAGMKPGTYPRRTEFYPTVAGFHFAEILNANKIWDKKFVILAPGPGLWPGRNWTEEKWIKVSRMLMDGGWFVCLVGIKSPNQYKNIPCSLNLTGLTTIDQLGALMKHKNAAFFVGIDSFPCHLAGAMGLPRVVLFGITKASLILCDSPKTFPVESDPTHPYTGARHKVELISSVMLGNPPKNPMDTISFDMVKNAIVNLLNP